MIQYSLTGVGGELFGKGKRMTPADLEAMIREDMRLLSDVRVAADISSLLTTPPRQLSLGWSYGAVGETFEGFLALEHPRSGTGIVYCSQGFGPANPWGMVFIDRGPLYTGTSDGWYARFLDTYFESKAPTDLDIWRVREWKSTRDGAWVSSELPWGEAWGLVSAMQVSTPNAQYYCDHAITY